MRILLVQPFVGHNPPTVSMKLSAKLSMEPNLTLQQLAGICPQEHELEAVDENRGDKIRFNNEYDLVGISCRTATSPRAYQIADEFRKREIPVVLGGYHPSALPEEATQHADSVILGEAEISLPKALHDLQKGTLQPRYQSHPVDPQLIPPANRDIIDSVLPIAAVEATRGCPLKCDFCFDHNVKGKKYRERPIINVIEEITSIKQKQMIFYDASLTIDPEYTKALFKNMIGLGKHFSCYGNVNILGNDEELLKLASDAGCVSWLIGFESISQQVINRIGKTTNKIEDYMRAVQKIKDHNMNVTGSFIFGFDEHTPETFNDTMEMIEKLEMDIATFNILTPFPGTPFLKRMEQEKRIMTYDWGRYTCLDTVFQPKHMTVQELYAGTIKAFKDYYSLIPTIQRIEKSSHLGIHPFFNSLLRNSFLFAWSHNPGRH